MLVEYASRFGPRSLPKRMHPFCVLMAHKHSTGECKSWRGASIAGPSIAGPNKANIGSSRIALAWPDARRIEFGQASSLRRRQNATRIGGTFARLSELWLPGSLGIHAGQRLCSASVPYQHGPLLVLVHGQLLLQVRRP